MTSIRDEMAAMSLVFWSVTTVMDFFKEESINRPSLSQSQLPWSCLGDLAIGVVFRDDVHVGQICRSFGGFLLDMGRGSFGACALFKESTGSVSGTRWGRWRRLYSLICLVTLLHLVLSQKAQMSHTFFYCITCS